MPYCRCGVMTDSLQAGFVSNNKLWMGSWQPQSRSCRDHQKWGIGLFGGLSERAEFGMGLELGIPTEQLQMLGWMWGNKNISTAGEIVSWCSHYRDSVEIATKDRKRSTT